MTNEELTVLTRLAEDLIASRESVKLLRSRIDNLDETFNETLKEYESARNECNRLRESEANALNAAEEAKRDRDEAREKLGEWMRFFVDTIYTALVRAAERKDCRKIVNGSVSAIRKFIYEHPVEVIEGSLAK